MVRSMYSDQFNHHPGQLLLHCGSPLVGRPSMGSWLLYGLGSESQNFPGFVVLSSGRGSSSSSGLFSNGFLPSVYQGVPFSSTGDPIPYLSNPQGITREDQRARIDLIRTLNDFRRQETGDKEIASRIASYELAFRMQTAAPELLDFAKRESIHARSLRSQQGANGSIREELSDGAAAGGTRRPIRAGFACKLGRPCEPGERAQKELRNDR